MLKLAKMLHEDVMKMCVRAPGVGEDSASYVENMVELKSLRCLVVADDVWEKEVVEKLRKTGMWVLVTTRTQLMVGAENSVVLDTLTQLEAEHLLRSAAELPRDERLCDDALNILRVCNFVAMDTAFVGSWTSVRTANGEPKSSKAWARTVREIEAQIEDVRGQAHVGNAGGGDDLEIKRLAVLRAGFKYLGVQDPLAQVLYVALAVFPDGHSFEESDAAVLLGDEDVADGPISILERWGVLRKDTSHRYRLHDAHVDFARDKLMGWEHVRKPAVDGWTSHISRLTFAISIDVYALLNLWRALELVGGKGWFDIRPYDDQLVSVDAMSTSKLLAVHVVAELYGHGRKYRERDAIIKKVLKQCDGHPRACAEVRMAALYYCRNSLCWQGRLDELADVERRLGEIIVPGVKLQLPVEGAGVVEKSVIFSLYGVCAKAARCYEAAEEWLRKVLKTEEDGGRAGSYQMCWAMFELGVCAREAGRPGEAETLLQRALEIVEIKLGPESLEVAATLHELGLCVREAGRSGEAEELLKRALEIFEIESGADDPQVAQTLYELGRCVMEAGRPEEAEQLLWRALRIEEAKLGTDDPEVAVTLRELGRCVRDVGRPEEAEELLSRAQIIAWRPKVIMMTCCSSWVGT